MTAPTRKLSNEVAGLAKDFARTDAGLAPTKAKLAGWKSALAAVPARRPPCTPP